MKAKKLRYNLSEIMRYAHSMWTAKPMAFKERLKMAWAKAKSFMASGKATGEFVIAVSTDSGEGVADWVFKRTARDLLRRLIKFK